jgi:hypothetical protein
MFKKALSLLLLAGLALAEEMVKAEEVVLPEDAAADDAPRVIDAAVVELTTENFRELTANKTVFVKVSA